MLGFLLNILTADLPASGGDAEDAERIHREKQKTATTDKHGEWDASQGDPFGGFFYKEKKRETRQP